MAERPMAEITASLVIYKTPVTELEALLDALGSDPCLLAWVVVDNGAAEDTSASRELRLAVEQRGARYVAAPANIGFGAGHNLALRSLQNTDSCFHLMLNPDVSFTSDVLCRLANRMHGDSRIGAILPRVIYPDGRDQFLAKLLPTPVDFALRRFAPRPIQWLARKRMARYELRGLVREESTAIPFLSGCFLLVRRSLLEAVGGFDERFFLYLEDVDLCRRLARVCTLLYFPSVTVVHGYSRGAHRSSKLMFTFLHSAILYFAKWGWIFDKGRREANRFAIAEFAVQSKIRRFAKNGDDIKMANHVTSEGEPREMPQSGHDSRHSFPTARTVRRR